MCKVNNIAALGLWRYLKKKLCLLVLEWEDYMKRRVSTIFRSMPVLSFQHTWKKNMIFLWMVELCYLFLVNRGIVAEKTIRYLLS